AAPRLVARERWDVVVGFGRTARQDVVRVGGGTHRTYLARMRAAGLRRAPLGPYHRAILWLERRQLAPGGHRRVLAVSARVRDEVAGDYGVPRERIAVIYNGVDLERFHPAERALLGPAVRRELGVEDGTRLCVAIGTGFRRKGFDLLLGLWRTAPPPHAVLALVGGDERLGAYRREASRLAGPRAPPSATRRDGWPSGCRGTRTSSAWRRSSRRWRVSGDPRPSLIRGGLRAWLAPGVRLADVAPGGDPDRLLTRPDCEVVKLQ